MCWELVVFGVLRNIVWLSDVGGFGNVYRLLEIVECVLFYGVLVEDVIFFEVEWKVMYFVYGVVFWC